MLSAVFRFQLPSLSSHPVLRDLLRSFALESAPLQLRPPAWDLTLVLRFLNTSNFEPLAEVPLRALTQKVLFLVAFATAKRVGELQALSSVVTFVHGDACLSYVPDFVAKSESLSRTIPRSFLVRSLSDFAAGLDDDLLLCMLSAFIWTVSLLCLLFAVDFSCLLVALHVLSRRTPSPSSCVTYFLMLGLLGLRWVASGLTTSAVCPPRSPFTVTGRSPRFWSRPLGPPVRCLRHFICAIFNTSSMASFLWVRL